MNNSMMALAGLALLAACSTGDGNRFAARDTTVQVLRVFDIKTDPASQAVAQAASAGINRRVPDATLALAPLGEVPAQPGRIQVVGAAPGAAAASGPSCEGARWTARATPKVAGGHNMNMVACLFPYKNGYHLDLMTVFTRKEGGWLDWPRRLTGRFMGTPEKWTDDTITDMVRSIRATGAEVALLEANPQVQGTPWFSPAPAAAQTQPVPEP